MSDALEFFRTQIEANLDSYLSAHETLEAADSGGGNRRTVANAAASSVDAEATATFANNVVNRIVAESYPKGDDGKPNVTGEPNLQTVFALWNAVVKAYEDSATGVAVEDWVKAEVEKLKASKTVTLSDEERAELAERRLNAYNTLQASITMLKAMAPTLPADGVNALLAQIERAKVTRPRKSSGPSGPRLKPEGGGKYEFYENNVVVADSLRRLADIHGVQQVAVKADIANQLHERGELEDLTDEVVKAWFNSAPNRFTFSLTDEKGNTHDVVALRAPKKSASAGESASDEDEDDDDDENGD